MGIIKNNHNYRIQILLLLDEVEITHGINLHFFLAYTFIKYIMVSHYIYIYIYIVGMKGLDKDIVHS